MTFSFINRIFDNCVCIVKASCRWCLSRSNCADKSHSAEKPYTGTLLASISTDIYSEGVPANDGSAFYSLSSCTCKKSSPSNIEENVPLSMN